VERPNTIVRSLAIGAPADGGWASALARSSGGSVEAIPDEATAAAIRNVARLEGIFTETAGGVTVAAAEAAVRRGVIRPGQEVVTVLTGNGLKTPDARRFGLGGGEDERDPNLAPVMPPSFGAFEAWLDSRR
jgi:threonine synthase